MTRHGIITPAYNAEQTLHQVFERIPPELWPRVSSCYVVDDGSKDGTWGALEALAGRWPDRIIPLRHEVNRGYGAAEKTLLQAALDNGETSVIMLHADGQYSPEKLGEVMAALDDGADIVQGSRFLGGGARAGGMPLYKVIANQALTWCENRVFRMNLAEFHSGYMSYARDFLEAVPFHQLSDSFDFDLEMLVLARILERRIDELAIPTIYADEVSHLNPIRYGFDVLGVMGKYLRGHYRKMLNEHRSLAD